MSPAAQEKCENCPLAGPGGSFAFLLHPKYRSLVGEYSRLKVYRRGELIVAQGHAVDGWHVLRNGQARLFISDADGREHTVRFAGPGDLIGGCAGDALGDRHEHCYSAEATMDETEVCHFPGEVMASVFSGCPQLAGAFLNLLVRHLSDSYRRLHSLTTESARERLLDALVRLAEAQGAQKGARSGGPRVTIGLARQQLADLLGVTKETAVRALSSLKGSGLIETRGQAITILDLDALRRYRDQSGV